MAPTPTTANPSVVPTPDAARAYADVATFASDIGPREATSPAFHRAAELVEARLAGLGYDVWRQDFPTPAGVSWGVPVRAGISTNVIATPRGCCSEAPHVVVGAHLDTVPQAPGAEDNASGVAVMLELARLVAAAPPPLPVVFVAFGSEEPRSRPNPQHTYHHFGSRAYVASLDQAERDALVGAIALDRVGVGDVVPVTFAGIGPAVLRDTLLAAGGPAGVPVAATPLDTGSDHLSFEMSGLVGARVGGTPYAAYHSPADTLAVVSEAQLGRVITLVWATLRNLAKTM